MNIISDVNCCVFCGHCDDEVIIEQSDCKCHCHTRGQ